MPSSQPPGILYVVATPIGNLEDLSDRARRVLSEVDIVAAEDTRRTQTLLTHFCLGKPIEMYHQHVEREKAEELLESLRAGKSIALVSDAGVPVVSDPGAHLVARAWEEGVAVSPIPGPSAVLSALSVSGFNADRFLFAGYPPRKASERRAFYRGIAHMDVPTVIHESPHRLVESLDDALTEIGPERMTLIAREMTKRYEELLRGPLGDLRPRYDEVEPIGEFTLVFAPAEASEAPPPSRGDARRAAQLLCEAGIPTRQAADILAAATGLSRNEAYALLIAARQ